MRCWRCNERTDCRRCGKCGAFHPKPRVPRAFDFSATAHPHRAFRRVARSGRLLQGVSQ